MSPSAGWMRDRERREVGERTREEGREGGRESATALGRSCLLPFSGHTCTHTHTRDHTPPGTQCSADQRLLDSGENPPLGPDTARPHPGPALHRLHLGWGTGREGEEGRERERECTRASAGEGEKERAILKRWKFLLGGCLPVAGWVLGPRHYPMDGRDGPRASPAEPPSSTPVPLPLRLPFNAAHQ